MSEAASYRLAVGGVFFFFGLSLCFFFWSDAVIFILLQMIWLQGSRKLRIHTAAPLLLWTKMTFVFLNFLCVDTVSATMWNCRHFYGTACFFFYLLVWHARLTSEQCTTQQTPACSYLLHNIFHPILHYRDARTYFCRTIQCNTRKSEAWLLASSPDVIFLLVLFFYRCGANWRIVVQKETSIKFHEVHFIQQRRSSFDVGASLSIPQCVLVCVCVCLGRPERVHFVRQPKWLFNSTGLLPAAESSQTDS